MTPGPTSSDELAAVLFARAKALATSAEVPAPGEAVELLTFAIGGARYALPTAQVSAVAPLPPVTRVPGAAVVIAGVTNHVGNVMLVAELPALLGLRVAPPRSDAVRYLLVVEEGEAEPLALIADELLEIRTVGRAALHPTGGEDGAEGTKLGRALTTDGCLVLDGRRLLADPRLMTTTR